MAEENYLSSVKVGGTDYEIYAKSALSAGWVPSTAIDGSIPASAITAVNESAISSVNISAVTAVNESAISSVAWSALTALTATSSQSGNTSGIWTPKTTVDYVTEVVKESISNVYKFKGTCPVEGLPTTNNQNGDVWNLSNGGVINSTSTEHSATVFKSDNVAWITAAAGGYWDKLAATENDAKLDTSAFTAWSASNASEFSGSAASANTAWLAVNVSGSASNVNGQDLINSAWSGAAASAWISTFTADGQPIAGIDGSYLSGDGTTANKLGLKNPESSIGTSTQASALVNAGGISSFVDSNYIAKDDIKVETHQLVINNL